MELLCLALIALSILREIQVTKHIDDLRAELRHRDAAVDLFHKATIAIRAIELGEEYRDVGREVARTIRPRPAPVQIVESPPEAVVAAESWEFQANA